MISLEKLKILQKLSKNVGDLGKLIAAKGFEKLPKSNKLPNLVTLSGIAFPNFILSSYTQSIMI